jgi:hypothetical protein
LTEDERKEKSDEIDEKLKEVENTDPKDFIPAEVVFKQLDEKFGIIRDEKTEEKKAAEKKCLHAIGLENE